MHVQIYALSGAHGGVIANFHILEAFAFAIFTPQVVRLSIVQCSCFQSVPRLHIRSVRLQCETRIY